MEKLFTRKEAAKSLGISLATLDVAKNNGQISYVQYVPNGCVYFTETSIQEYIQDFQACKVLQYGLKAARRAPQFSKR